MDELEISELVSRLRFKDNTVGCGAMKRLVEISPASRDVYAYFDEFTDMLSDKNSYVRNRAVELIAANAAWDAGNKLPAMLDAYLALVNDPKPITARQCIKNLPKIAAAQPTLKGRIKRALLDADPSAYPDSMRPLVEKDIIAALRALS